MVGPVISFRVDGVPVPQGSKTVARGGGKVWLRDANAARLKPWRAEVAAAADLGHTFDGPVFVAATFFMPRPQRPKWWSPAVKPDVDKLTRALFDGMTDGGLLADDARVTRAHVEKRYATDAHPAGVLVVVAEDEEVE